MKFVKCPYCGEEHLTSDPNSRRCCDACIERVPARILDKVVADKYGEDF